jgi:V/A-type H+-transporting ATPase subunit D
MTTQGKTSRLELLRLRKRGELVAKGINILSSKRDALLAEFRGAVLEVRDRRKALDDNILSAQRALTIAEAVEPASTIMTQSLSAQRKIAFDISLKNVWGVKIPSIDFPDLRRDPFERGSAPGFRNPAVDEASQLFEEALDCLMKSAVAEHRLLSIGGAIRAATRRVNALERKVAPEIKKDIGTIMANLEEKAREETFRLKRYKSLRERRGE